MNIFISWSGKLGKQIAEELRTWLPTVIQAIKPFYSPDDIAKGKNWNRELTSQLSNSKIGIIIITPECLEASWLLFEAGAISSRFTESSVCPVLFGLNPTDITGPLLQFQVTPFEKAEFKKLLLSINSNLEEQKLSQDVLDRAFETFWPQLNSKLTEIIEAYNSEIYPSPKRAEREILEEILTLVRKESHRNYLSYESAKLSLVLFDENTQCILVNTGHPTFTYDIDVHRLNSGSGIVDFIFQMARKSWCTADHIFQFVKIIELLSQSNFGVNAQGIFCPSGRNEIITWPENIRIDY